MEGKIIGVLKKTLWIGEEKEEKFNYLGIHIENTKEKITMDQDGYIKRMYRGQ